MTETKIPINDILLKEFIEVLYKNKDVKYKRGGLLIRLSQTCKLANKMLKECTENFKANHNNSLIKILNNKHIKSLNENILRAKFMSKIKYGLWYNVYMEHWIDIEINKLSKRGNYYISNKLQDLSIIDNYLIMGVKTNILVDIELVHMMGEDVDSVSLIDMISRGFDCKYDVEDMPSSHKSTKLRVNDVIEYDPPYFHWLSSTKDKRSEHYQKRIKRLAIKKENYVEGLKISLKVVFPKYCSRYHWDEYDLCYGLRRNCQSDIRKLRKEDEN